jgi:hypothetical protein
VALAPVWRAYAAVWLSRGHLLRAHRHALVSVGLVVLGLGGGLAGGALIGEWCLGVVMIAEAALVVFVGFARDDGRGLPVAGERTVADVLRAEARRP